MVACRITSEDANDGFKPTCGLIEELSFRSTPEVWGYFSVKSGGGIHEFSDSQVRSSRQANPTPCHRLEREQRPSCDMLKRGGCEPGYYSCDGECRPIIQNRAKLLSPVCDASDMLPTA